MTVKATYPLRLPKSIKAAVERIAKEEGISVNQFVATAVAEKLSALRTADYLATRAGRADLDRFRAILTRRGGAPPRDGDERA